jgi:hypothetical protein
MASNQTVFAFQLVARPVLGKPAGIKSKAIRTPGWRFQEVVALNPGRHPLWRRALEVGEGHMRLIAARLRLQPHLARRGLAAGGQARERFAGRRQGVHGRHLRPLAETAYPLQLHLEGRGGNGGEGAVEVGRHGLLNIAEEAQGDVEVVGGAPARPRQALLAASKGFADLIGNRQGGEETDHGMAMNFDVSESNTVISPAQAAAQLPNVFPETLRRLAACASGRFARRRRLGPTIALRSRPCR